MVFHHQHSGLIDKPRLNLHLFDGVSFDGIDNLDPSLTINGTTKTPLFRYRAKDANLTDWAGWDYGVTLSANGSGGIFNAGSPLLGSSDDSVDTGGARFWKSASSDAHSVTTEDITLEAVIRFDSVNGARVFNQRNVSGYELVSSTSNRMSFVLDVGGSNGSVVSGTDDLVHGHWHHIMAFINRDEASTNGSRFYINGVESGTGNDLSSLSATIAADEEFHIGCYGPATNNFYNEPIAYVAMWIQASWHQAGASGPTEWAAIAKDRYARLSGVYPVRARGTAIPNTMSRSSTAYIDKSDDYGTDEMANAWDGLDNFVSDAATATTDVTASPDGREVFVVAEDGTAGVVHRLYRGSGSFGITDIMEVSCVAKQINRNWFRLSANTTGGAFTTQGTVYYDLNAGVTSAPQDVLDSGIEDLGNGWYRCWFTKQAEAAGSTVALLYLAVSSGGIVFDGLSQDSIYATTPQIRLGPHRRLYPVGDNWLRQVRRKDSSGTEIKGYLAEGAVENLCLQSQDFSTTWVTARTTVSTDTVTAPDDTVTADTLVEDGTAAISHLLTQTINLSSGTQYAFSCFIKAANRDWTLLYNTTEGSYTYFDVGSGVKGAFNGIDESNIEDWGNGWYRCWLTFTSSTTAAHNFRIYVAEANGDTTFDGLTQDSLYLWQAQVEAGAYPSSIIPTTTATVTRSADLLQYKGDDGNIPNIQRGVMTCQTFTEAYDLGVNAYICEISDGGATADRIGVYAAAGSDNGVMYTRATAGNNGDANSGVDLSDGTIHDVKVQWATNAVSIDVDGTTVSDSTADIADDLDEIDVGHSLGNTAQFNGVIADLKFRG